MKIPHKIIIPILLFILIVSVISFTSITEEEDNISENTDVDYKKLDEIIFDVKTQNVIRGNLIKTISATGYIRANKELEIISNINGFIKEITVDEGQKVNAGDTLIKFDDREHEISLKDAEVKVIDARVEYGFLTRDTVNESSDNRKAEEVKKQIDELNRKFIAREIKEEEYLQSKDELDMKLLFTGAKREEVIQNKSGLTSAINMYKKARLNFNYTKITAPFSGVIGDFSLVESQRITAGDKLFKLFDISTLKIEIGVLESEITQIKIGNKVIVELNVFPGEMFYGKVSNISPFVDGETRTNKIVVELKNTGHKKIKPGMFVHVKIEFDKLENRTLIPKDALLVRDKRNLVFTFEDNTAKWKYVDIGEQNDDYIEIINGVKSEEKVIVEGHFTLAHGAKVKVIN